jgi:hypothetical protein
MTTDHTPGPWAAEDVRSGKYHVYFRINAQGESAHIAGVYPHYGNAEANARLIAAAPDLLAALKLIADASECFAPSEEDEFTAPAHRLWVAITEARAAIARAKGQA